MWEVGKDRVLKVEKAAILVDLFAISWKSVNMNVLPSPSTFCDVSTPKPMVINIHALKHTVYIL